MLSIKKASVVKMAGKHGDLVKNIDIRIVVNSSKVKYGMFSNLFVGNTFSISFTLIEYTRYYLLQHILKKFTVKHQNMMRFR